LIGDSRHITSQTTKAHQNGQLAVRLEGDGAVAAELAVAAEEVFQRRGPPQIAGIIGVELLPELEGAKGTLYGSPWRYWF